MVILIRLGVVFIVFFVFFYVSFSLPPFFAFQHMQHDNINKDRDRCNTIIDRLERLSIEARDLGQELRNLQEPPSSSSSSNFRSNDHPYQIGDKVTITNSYLGNYGICGTVTTVTAKRITLTDSGGKNTHKKTNKHCFNSTTTTTATLHNDGRR